MLQWGLKRARRQLLRIIEPKRNELQIDLDGALAVRRYGLQFAVLRKAGLTRGWRERIKPSKSGGSRVHITITLPRPIDNMKRVALQAVLGSDLIRECFNICRVIKGNKYPIVFFERQNADQRKRKA